MARRSLKGFSVAQLQKALAKQKQAQSARPLERQRDKLSKRLATLEKKIEKLKGKAGPGPGRPKKTRRQKRKMSAAGRKAIAAAQKKRWAKIKAAKAKA